MKHYYYIKYDNTNERLPEVVCENAKELANILGVSVSTIFYRLRIGDPLFAKVEREDGE